ncbi:MAG: lipid-transfer protein [Acidimicrobiales bacterium]|nr:lipid-transfer protein [Acidimicrobiales bacterium]
MTYPLRDRCAIAGIGATEFSKKSGRSVLALGVEASLAAIADAGMTVDDIDGIVRCDLDSLQHNDLAHALGLPELNYWGAAGVGGGAPCGMVAQAAAAVLSGQAKSVLVFRALNGRSGQRYGHGAAVSAAVGGNGSYDEYFLPHGLLSPGQMYGLVAQRHMAEFGTTSEDFAHIAIACRDRANANPNAQMHDKTLTMDDYMAGRMISDPLRVFDFCQETDGACAVVVTTAERAKDGPNPAATIRAAVQSGMPDMQGGMLFPALMRPTLTTQPSASAAAKLYERAGLGPSDIDVAQIYDCFTITVLLQLEDYGFCAKGEGGSFASSGALQLDGSLPINTAGGNLSEGYIHGLNHVVEGVRQIRGTSTSQVPDAEVCLVTSGIPVSTSAMILTKA